MDEATDASQWLLDEETGPTPPEPTPGSGHDWLVNTASDPSPPSAPIQASDGPVAPPEVPTPRLDEGPGQAPGRDRTGPSMHEEIVRAREDLQAFTIVAEALVEKVEALERTIATRFEDLRAR